MFPFLPFLIFFIFKSLQQTLSFLTERPTQTFKGINLKTIDKYIIIILRSF